MCASSRPSTRGSTSAGAAPTSPRGRRSSAPGDVLTPSRVGALAAIGLTEVDVFAQPRVAILSTGDEIVAPGQPLAPGQIYDINRFTLSSIVTAHGGVAVAYPAAADDLPALNAAAAATSGDDILRLLGRKLGRRARSGHRRDRRPWAR